MSRSIDNLMNEHQLILRVLASLNTAVTELQNGRRIPRQHVADFAEFFRGFADKCHHCKEEDRLFVTMNQYGFPREFGPVAVMLSEHTMGRAHVRELWEIGQQSGPLTNEDVQRVVEHGSAFVPLLSGHISKEDNILYPMALNAIPPQQLERLDGECESFEREVMAPGEVEKLKDVAARLIQAYPADFERFSANRACFSCH